MTQAFSATCSFGWRVKYMGNHNWVEPWLIKQWNQDAFYNLCRQDVCHPEHPIRLSPRSNLQSSNKTLTINNGGGAGHPKETSSHWQTFLMEMLSGVQGDDTWKKIAGANNGQIRLNWCNLILKHKIYKSDEKYLLVWPREVSSPGYCSPYLPRTLSKDKPVCGCV